MNIDQPLRITILPVTESALADALTEWDRRYRADPGAFQSDFARIAKGVTTTEYGDAAGRYLWTLLTELEPE